MSDYIKNDRTFSLGLDTDGVEHTTKELQERIILILEEIDRICRKNNIPYALAFGSALGLVNYGGFLPWDDDADIVIDYFDISRFVEAMKNDLSDSFRLEGYEVDKRYNVLIPTFKLRLVDSYQKEKNWFTLPNKCETGSGFFIDICAFHGVPADLQEHKRLLRKAKNIYVPYVIYDAFLRGQPYKMKKELKDFEKETAEFYKDSPYVSQSIIIPWQDMPKIIEHNSFPREVIYPFKDVEFEGRKFMSFNNPEKFVELRYGKKWMKKWDGEKWIDTMPEASKSTTHTRKYNLYKSK
jgi:lipopolysaccharide cholinephosphotransferase